MVDYFAILLGLTSIVLGAWEYSSFRKRVSEKPSQRPVALKRLKRRMCGIVLLLIAVGMVVADTVLRDVIKGNLFVLVYWSIGFLCALGVFMVVLIDIKHTAQEMLVDHQKIIEDAIKLQELGKSVKKNNTARDE